MAVLALLQAALLQTALLAVLLVLGSLSPVGASAQGGDASGADRIPIAEPGVEGSIVRLYRAAFGRAPDIDGLNFWVWRYVRGQPLVTIADGFATSSEFASTYGPLDDEAFVDRLYANVLGRGSDPDGAAFWRGRLDAGATRAEVLTGIAESSENQLRTSTAPPLPPAPAVGTDASAAAVTRLYQATFLRAPDRAGLAHWLSRRSSGTPLLEIASSFAGSGEFVARYGLLDDDDFVELIYANVLGRPADDDGRAFWSSVATTEGRGAVLDGLAQSDEFADRTGTPRLVDEPIAPRTRPLPAEVLVIGDSILEGFRLTGLELGGSSTTYDTEVGRQISVLGERIDAARDDGSLAPVVIIHLGTNGWPAGADSLLATELASLDEHEVILVDVHADRSWTASANAAIDRNAERFEHVRLVRWSTIAVAGDHLRSDGVHPSASGRLALGTALVDLLQTSP